MVWYGMVWYERKPNVIYSIVVILLLEFGFLRFYFWLVCVDRKVWHTRTTARPWKWFFFSRGWVVGTGVWWQIMANYSNWLMTVNDVKFMTSSSRTSTHLVIRHLVGAPCLASRRSLMSPMSFIDKTNIHWAFSSAVALTSNTLLPQILPNLLTPMWWDCLHEHPHGWQAKAEEVLMLIDTVCLQPEVWNDLSNLISKLATKDTSQNRTIVLAQYSVGAPSGSCQNTIFCMVLMYYAANSCSAQWCITNRIEVRDDAVFYRILCWHQCSEETPFSFWSNSISCYLDCFILLVANKQFPKCLQISLHLPPPGTRGRLWWAFHYPTRLVWLHFTCITTCNGAG